MTLHALLILLEDFHDGVLDLDQLNLTYSFLFLKEGALLAKDLRPINLLNSLYKITTKILSIRLSKFLPSLLMICNWLL